MARNDTINVTAAEWTQITNANASAIRVQNLSNSYAVLLKATNGTTAPTTDAGAVRLARRARRCGKPLAAFIILRTQTT